MRLRVLRALGAISLAYLLLLSMGPGVAHALQFTPGPNARLHFFTDGQPGATWNTGGVGVNGQIEYRSINAAVDPGLLTLGGRIDVLNYWDPDVGACSTQFTNCSFNYTPDLALNIEAQFVEVTETPAGGTVVTITAKWTTTNDGLPDITWTDPSDASDPLEARWAAGTFFGSPTTGLEASVNYDTATDTIIGTPSVLGFSLVSSSVPYSGLFNDAGSLVQLDLSEFFDFAPTLLSIVQTTRSTGVVPSFTAEGQGQLFRVESGQFTPVPEPSSALLLAVALGALSRLRRAREI